MSGVFQKSVQEISRQDKREGGRGSPYTRPTPSSKPSSDDKWQHDMYSNASRDGKGRPAISDIPTQKLLVEGLHYEITDAELDGLFQQIGPTEKCFIRYDRSGRSTGTATVIYKDVNNAINAKREYDGANAKGQPIKLTFEVYRDFKSRGTQGAPTGPASAGKGTDLLTRLSGGDLGSRIGGGPARGQPPSNAPRGPSHSFDQSRPGPQRTISGDGRGRGAFSRGGSRGGRGNVSRGGRGAGRGAGRGGGRGPAPTASNLDAELDAFMKTPSTTSAPADGDVEMK